MACQRHRRPPSNWRPVTETYLNVDWVASWTQGYPPASYSFAPNTFAILAMAPQVAQGYLPTLGYLGER